MVEFDPDCKKWGTISFGNDHDGMGGDKMWWGPPVFTWEVSKFGCGVYINLINSFSSCSKPVFRVSIQSWTQVCKIPTGACITNNGSLTTSDRIEFRCVGWTDAIWMVV